MKINLIIHSFYPAVEAGGPIFSTINTCKELSKIDTEIFVSTTNFLDSAKRVNSKPNKWFNLSKNIHIKYYSELNFGRFSISFRQLLFLWKDISKVDIVHIQGIFNVLTLIALLYSKLLNKKTFLSPRGSVGVWCLESGSPFKKFWLKYLIKPFTNKIIWHATAQQEHNEIKSLFSNANIKIIPNGISLDEYKYINRLSKSEYVKQYIHKEININKVIISMGRIQEKKGFDILIKSFKIILKKYPNSILLIAGKEENTIEGTYNKLILLIENLDLQNNVFFVGQIENQNKVDFLANADLFCLPSHNENFGNVYAESLASGTPIVASKNTPWSEVEEFQCGRWVNNTVEDTSNAILYLLSQDQKQLSENSKQYIKKFTWKNIAKQFKNIYQDKK